MSSGFVSEADLAEARKRRQDEWEKVRTADDPKDRPEEPYDGRSLYDRLKEQKLKKDMEYQEAHKLKNLIRRLDDDEVQFLELVDKSKLKAEQSQLREEETELREFRQRVATLQEEYVDKKLQSEIMQPKNMSQTIAINTYSNQKSLLGSGVKRKQNINIDTSTIPSSSNNKLVKTESKVAIVSNEGVTATAATTSTKTPLDNISTNQFDKGEFKCVGILPGIGCYAETSDSELSSDSEDEPDTQSKYDLVGRKQQKKKQCQEE